MSWFGHVVEDIEISSSFEKMQQSLCTELVYTILTTITQHTDGEQKKKYQEYDFSNKKKYVLENLYVKDPSKFGG